MAIGLGSDSGDMFRFAKSFMDGQEKYCIVSGVGSREKDKVSEVCVEDGWDTRGDLRGGGERGEEMGEAVVGSLN